MQTAHEIEIYKTARKLAKETRQERRARERQEKKSVKHKHKVVLF